MNEPGGSVLLFGTFDGLHEGHRHMLKQARAHGDTIHVIVARDSTVLQVKGRMPKYGEIDRLLALQNELVVTRAQLGSVGDKYEAIKSIQPAVIALGYDQQAFTERLQSFLTAHAPHTRIVRLKAYLPEQYKSSLLN